MLDIAPQLEYSPVLKNFLRKGPRLLINGEWVSSEGGQTLPVYDPCSAEQIASIAEATSRDVHRAVTAARGALEAGSWAGMSPYQRERLIHRLADALERDADAFVELEAVDNGKPRAMAALVDLPDAVAKLRYLGGWTTKIAGLGLDPVTQASGTFHAYTRREPVGVVGLIVPWNFPLGTAVQKLAAALAAGCTVVLKPAEQTSLSALRLGELVSEVGFPDGVMNIVTGLGETVGDALVRHPDVDKISFTGSTEVGKTITRTAADTLKRVALELGGNSPFIVMPDADLSLAAQGAGIGIFFNSGQTCTAGKRLYAHRDVFDRVVEDVAGVAAGFRLGPSLAEYSQLGPLVSDEQQQRVLEFVSSARAQGASVVTGGAPGGSGYYVEPTVIANVRSDMRVMREEVFGPVACVSRFDDLDEVAGHANDTPFGLAASVWTRDASVMHRLADKIKVGTVWGNCHNIIDVGAPFGGFKQSGTGRELGQDGVLAFTELKSVLIAL